VRAERGRWLRFTGRKGCTRESSAAPEYSTAPARSKNRDALNAEINALTEKKSTDTCGYLSGGVGATGGKR
jgi:crotonobetainyl-CoA:carnitine CoA-transferase CaiB-like acyl-CoA transferase